MAFKRDIEEQQRIDAEEARVGSLLSELNRLKTRVDRAVRLVVALRCMVHDDNLIDLGERDAEIAALGIKLDLSEVSPRPPMVRKRIGANTPEGTPVIVLRDQNRELLVTRTRSAPWQLDHGAWIVSVDGISGGYALERVFHLGNDPKPTEPG